MERELLQREVRFLADLEVGVDLPVAGLGSRALAQIVDTAILGAIWIAMFLLILVLGVVLDWGGFVMAALIVGQFLLNWGWFFAWELLWSGQTPGKRAVGLRVVHSDGTNLAFTACLIRNLLRVIDFLPFFYGIGTLLIFLTRRSQRLGDMAAGTLVVREDKRPTSQPVRRWPDGMRAEDISLVEAFFHEAPTLLPDRRELLASRIVELLETDYPGFIAIQSGWSRWETLRHAFEPQDRRV